MWKKSSWRDLQNLDAFCTAPISRTQLKFRRACSHSAGVILQNTLPFGKFCPKCHQLLFSDFVFFEIFIIFSKSYDNDRHLLHTPNFAEISHRKLLIFLWSGLRKDFRDDDFRADDFGFLNACAFSGDQTCQGAESPRALRALGR